MLRQRTAGAGAPKQLGRSRESMSICVFVSVGLCYMSASCHALTDNRNRSSWAQASHVRVPVLLHLPCFFVLSVPGPKLSVPEHCENPMRQSAVGGKGKAKLWPSLQSSGLAEPGFLKHCKAEAKDREKMHLRWVNVTLSSASAGPSYGR